MFLCSGRVYFQKGRIGGAFLKKVIERRGVLKEKGRK